MNRLSEAQIEGMLRQAQDAFARGDATAAHQLVDEILSTNPESEGARIGKGVFLARQGKQEEALRSFKTAIKINPQNDVALAWAAMTALGMRRGTEAEAFARSLIQIQPRNDRAYFLLTNALCLQDRLTDALEPVGQALSLKPNEPDYVVGKAQILGRLTWASQAIEWYRRALSLRPSSPLAFELVASMIQEGQVNDAIPILEQYIENVPPENRPYPLMGQAYTEAQRFEEAERIWPVAIRYAPNLLDLTLTRVTSEISAGRLGVAEELLQEALRENPLAAQLYKPFATIRKMTDADLPVIENMERASSLGDLSHETQMDLAYSLGKAYNDLGDYDLAIKNYDQANRLAYESSLITKKFSAGEWSAYTSFLIEFFTEARIKSLVQEGLESELSLFIVGMIRSGTTLSEQILSRHSQVQDGGEKTFWADHRDEVVDANLSRFDSKSAKRLGLEFLEILGRSAKGHRFVSEKNPSNILIAAALHCVYPNSKFVHIERNAVDNALSIWMTPLKTGLPFVFDRRNIVAAFKDYRRLKEHLERVMPVDRYRTFKYEDLTSTPRKSIGKMLNFLGLDLEEDCFSPEGNSRTVRTPSFYQVRQAINTDSQNRWKRYEPWLGEFAELLD